TAPPPGAAAARSWGGGGTGFAIFLRGKGKKRGRGGPGGRGGGREAPPGGALFAGARTNTYLGCKWRKRRIAGAFLTQKRAQAFYASAAVTDKLVIAGSRDKRVYAVDRETGKEAWSLLTRGKVDSSPVVVGKRVFVGSLDGHLYVLDLEKGTEIMNLDLE